MDYPDEYFESEQPTSALLIHQPKKMQLISSAHATAGPSSAAGLANDAVVAANPHTLPRERLLRLLRASLVVPCLTRVTLPGHYMITPVYS